LGYIIAETIVTQDNQIITMGKTMDKMTEDFKKAHQEVLTYAHKNIQLLKNQNDAICEMLKEANNKMNNFAFNIQVTLV
jgi:hypothetical protein